jgi:hypothetical protein
MGEGDTLPFLLLLVSWQSPGHRLLSGSCSPVMREKTSEVTHVREQMRAGASPKRPTPPWSAGKEESLLEAASGEALTLLSAGSQRP